MDYPKFEKVDNNTIKIISLNTKEMPYVTYEVLDNNIIRISSEHVDTIALKELLNTKVQMEQKVEGLQKVLKNINEVIENAEKLGIAAEENKE